MSTVLSTPRRDFVAAQIAALDPYGFVVVGVAEPPFGWVRVTRSEEGELDLEVGLADPKAAFTDAQVQALTGCGLERVSPGVPSAMWRSSAHLADPETAAAAVERVIAEVFGAEAVTRMEVRHGSMREEHEAQEKVAAMRARIEPVLTSMLGRAPASDDDGDFVIDVESARVFVAPRAGPGRPSIIRVFAITNLDVDVTPELGTYLARVNFGLMFGRFALDVEGRSVWFDETLLGDHITDELLRFTVNVVADTANEYDDRIAQQFGGHTFRGQKPPTETPTPKPGEGGYL